MALPKRSINVEDALWDKIKEQADRNRRSLSGEVVVALEVYAYLARRNDPVIQEALDGQGR